MERKEEEILRIKGLRRDRFGGMGSVGAEMCMVGLTKTKVV